MENPINRKARELKEARAKAKKTEATPEPRPTEFSQVAQPRKSLNDPNAIKKLMALKDSIEPCMWGSGLSWSKKPEVKGPDQGQKDHVLECKVGGRQNIFKYNKDTGLFDYIEKKLHIVQPATPPNSNTPPPKQMYWGEVTSPLDGIKTSNLTHDEAVEVFIAAAAEAQLVDETNTKIERYYVSIASALLLTAAVAFGLKQCSPDANAAAHYQSENVAGMTYEGN